MRVHAHDTPPDIKGRGMLVKGAPKPLYAMNEYWLIGAPLTRLIKAGSHQTDALEQNRDEGNYVHHSCFFLHHPDCRGERG